MVAPRYGEHDETEGRNCSACGVWLICGFRSAVCAPRERLVDTKLTTVTGTVTEFIWSNPHVWLKMDAKDANGNVQHWIVEAQNTVSMRAIGCRPDTFKPGDVVSVDVNQAKNGRPIGSTLAGSSPTSAKRRIIINGKQFQ